MASNFFDKKMEPSGEAALSQEKLLEKYKAALGIAQKAKNARDEAIKNSKIIISENENLREKIKALEKRYATAEEMLGALTSQKLKLAMEIDDLKKQNAFFINELKMNEKCGNEIETLKEQNNVIVKEYEEIKNKLTLRENESVRYQRDVEDLQNKNVSLQQLLSSLKNENEDLDNTFKITLQKLDDLKENQNIVNTALSKKYNTILNDFKDWAKVINHHESDLSNDCKRPILGTNISNKDTMPTAKEKESIDQEIDLNEKVLKLKEELDVANSDKDKMMTNLEKVALETKQLIENSEKLTDEINILKQENNKQNNLINSLHTEKETLLRIIKENEDTIDRLYSEIKETNTLNEKLMLKTESVDNQFSFGDSSQPPKSLDFLEDQITPVDTNNTERSDLEYKEKIDIEKERSVNSELNQLQEELQVFSCEIRKHKNIADDYKQKYHNSLKELDDKNIVLHGQLLDIEKFKLKIAYYEEQHETLSNYLAQCKEQLLSALEGLSQADEIKNALELASNQKEHVLAAVLQELEEKKALITQKVEIIEKLQKELNTNNSAIENLSSEINIFRQESITKQKEITSLTDIKKDLEAVIEKKAGVHHINTDTFQKEIVELNEILTSYKSQNQQLIDSNSKLNKEIDILIKQINSDQKQAMIDNLDKEITILRQQVTNVINENEELSNQRATLKLQIEELCTSHSKEYETLKKEITSLIDIKNNLEAVVEKNTGVYKLNTEKLQKEIVELNDILTSYKSQNQQLIDENSKLNKEIDTLVKQINSDQKQAMIDNLDKEITTLRQQVTNVINENEELSNQRATLKLQIEELRTSHAKEYETLKKEITSLIDIKNNLESIIEKNTGVYKLNTEKLQKEIVELNDILTSYKSQNQQLFDKNSKLNQEIDILSKQMNDLKLKIEELCTTHNIECETLKKKNKDLQLDLEEHVSKSNEIKSTFTRLKSDFNNLSDVVNDLKVSKEALLKEKSEIDVIIRQTVSCLLDVNNKVIIDIARLKQENNELVGVQMETKETCMNSDNLITISNKLQEDQNILHNGITMTLNAIEKLIDENKNVKTQLEKALSESSNFTELLQKFNLSSRELEEKKCLIDEFEKEKCSLVKENEVLNSSNLSLNEKLEKMNAEYSALSSHCGRLEKSESTWKVEKDELNLLVKGLRDSLCEMENKMVVLQENKEASDNKECIEEISKQNSILLEENIKFKEQISEDKKIIGSLENELENKLNLLSSNETSYKKDIEKKDQLVLTFEEDIKTLRGKLDELSAINETLSNDLELLRSNMETLRANHAEEKNVLMNKYNDKQVELKNCNELLNFKTLELKENNRIWAGRFSSLKIALIGLNKSRKELKNQYECIENLFNAFIDHYKESLQEKVKLVVEHSVSAAKHELINEMHQMNQALRERGESISKLEFALTEYQSKIKQLTILNETIDTALAEAKDNLKQHEAQAAEKDAYIKQLEHENEQFKDSHDNTADSDILSTSTVSRSDEYSRLRDVEDSFEDRYTKLKLLAVKMKKRIMELTQTLETERTKMNAERIEIQEKISSMSMTVKNAQKIQELFDQSLDECDEQKKKNKVLENTVDELKCSEEKLKSKIAALETNNQNIPVMKKHIDSLNAIIKESKDNYQKLQLENKAENIKYEEMKKNNSKLETKIQQLTRSLEQAKQQGKNSNVLELEMKNYEKIIADLSSQLATEKTLSKNLQSKNDVILNMKVGLEEQISILEKQIKVEEERNQHTNEQLNAYRAKLEEHTAHVDSLNSEIESLQKQLGQGNIKIEALTLEMSQVSSEFNKKEISMTMKIGALQEQIRSLETSLLSTKQELETSKNEIHHLEEEYESYKLRAQTILSKRKGEFVTHGEKEAKEEVEKLKKDCKLLEEKLEAYVSEIDTLNTRKISLTLEKARSDKKYEEMKGALQQKILDYDLLNSEFYSYKMANEATIENLKDELSRKKQEYQSELFNQKKIIDELTTEYKLKEDSNQGNNNEKTENYIYSFQDSIPLPYEREDGEGSESVPSPQTRRSSSIVPLDVLLNTPILDENKVTVLQEQVDKLRRELSSNEVRCRHLTSLLSETEKDSARNLHQNKILKEELRRLERSLERQPHVANTEYLKNVVFKFVTLPHGDERSRLIPVLDTLLKLSPEECHKLTSVARGEAQAGWSSYLQSWTGL